MNLPRFFNGTNLFFMVGTKMAKFAVEVRRRVRCWVVAQMVDLPQWERRTSSDRVGPVNKSDGMLPWLLRLYMGMNYYPVNMGDYFMSQ